MDVVKDEVSSAVANIPRETDYRSDSHLQKIHPKFNLAFIKAGKSVENRLLQQQVDGMDDAVRGGNIRGHHIAVVHLHLAVGLLQRQGGATGHRVLDLVEAHASGEQRARHQVFGDKLLGHFFVRHQIRQFLR